MSIDLSNLDAAELDALIARAAQRRAELSPPVSMDVPRYSYAFVDPRWYINAVEGGTLLYIRHPGLGWMSFCFPPNETANVIRTLRNLTEGNTSAPAQPQTSSSTPSP